MEELQPVEEIKKRISAFRGLEQIIQKAYGQSVADAIEGQVGIQEHYYADVTDLLAYLAMEQKKATQIPWILFDPENPPTDQQRYLITDGEDIGFGWYHANDNRWWGDDDFCQEENDIITHYANIEPPVKDLDSASSPDT